MGEETLLQKGPSPTKHFKSPIFNLLDLQHFAFETLPVSTHHSGEKRGLRQNPRHFVAAAAFASAEQFQCEIALSGTLPVYWIRRRWRSPRQAKRIRLILQYRLDRL